jgi:hypothetical protein
VHGELDLGEVASALLRWKHTADDPLAPAARVVEDELDRLDPVGCAPSGRTAAACYSGQLGAQDRVYALGEARA